MTKLNENEVKFLAWDWDEGCYKKIPSNDPAEAIHIAWNYEFDVYRAEDKKLIFSGMGLDNEDNSELLKPYGLRLIDQGTSRKLQSIETGEILEAPWDKNNV